MSVKGGAKRSAVQSVLQDSSYTMFVTSVFYFCCCVPSNYLNCLYSTRSLFVLIYVSVVVFFSVSL